MTEYTNPDARGSPRTRSPQAVAVAASGGSPLASPLAGGRRLVAAGNSVVAVPPDGSKHPRGRWKAYQGRRPIAVELTGWFATGRNGPAVVCGRISGGREVIDFDRPGAFGPWCEAVERRRPGLAGRLTVVATPRPGFQVHYRCPDAVEGNQPLAREPKTPTADDPAPFATVIETRGEGGLALTPYCPPGCHPRRRRYVLLRGDFDAPARITLEERADLLAAARGLDAYAPPRATTGGAGVSAPRAAHGDRPGDAYNARADWPALLEPHGWRPLSRRGDVTMWQRPGKRDGGGSATTNFAGSNLLYVFSSNASPFEAETSYTLFAAYAVLRHGADFAAAARTLAELGYGRPGRDWRGADGIRRRVFVAQGGA